MAPRTRRNSRRSGEQARGCAPGTGRTRRSHRRDAPRPRPPARSRQRVPARSPVRSGPWSPCSIGAWPVGSAARHLTRRRRSPPRRRPRAADRSRPRRTARGRSAPACRAPPREARRLAAASSSAGPSPTHRRLSSGPRSAASRSRSCWVCCGMGGPLSICAPVPPLQHVAAARFDQVAGYCRNPGRSRRHLVPAAVCADLLAVWIVPQRAALLRRRRIPDDRRHGSVVLRLAGPARARARIRGPAAGDRRDPDRPVPVRGLHPDESRHADARRGAGDRGGGARGDAAVLPALPGHRFRDRRWPQVDPRDRSRRHGAADAGAALARASCCR